jgi:hypothetical protein
VAKEDLLRAKRAKSDEFFVRCFAERTIESKGTTNLLPIE